MKILNILTRIYITPDEIESRIYFYEQLFQTRCKLRFQHKELELASIGSILLIAGTLEKNSLIRLTQATFVVDSINEFKDFLNTQKAEILEEPKEVPTGFNMRVKHPDGIIIEYVEFHHVT